MNIYTLLQTKTDFTSSEKIIAEYILENPEKVIHMSAQEISEACFVSVTSIYRLATKCGTSGLSDLKVKLSSSLSEYKKMDETFDFDYPIKKYQTHHEMIELLKEDYNQTVLETSHLFDLDTLQGIVQLWILLNRLIFILQQVIYSLRRILVFRCWRLENRLMFLQKNINHNH